MSGVLRTDICPKSWRYIDTNIHDKVTFWFEIIGKQLHDPLIHPENVYNMDETGVLLSMLGCVKVLVDKDDPRAYRGAGVKRTMITAIECVSADGRSLHPLIIWPAATHRSNWTTHCWIPGPLTQRAAYRVAPPDPPAYQADGPLNMYINVAILIRLNIITSSSDSLHTPNPWMALCVLRIGIYRLQDQL
jgi:hypothetical protein